MEEGKWPNLYAISYKQNEGSYLAGVLAALVTESKDMPNANEDKKIGFVGGSEHPIITDFLVGYIAGAKSVDPDIKVYVSYIGSWDDTAKGKETAIAQYNQGVDIIFPAAEQAGLGCVEAAAEMGKYIIGVEPMPYSGIPDMKKGWAVVKAADCENAKLIMDTWHWVRANQPVDLSVIEDIPADKIVSIQINDVWERPYATTILRDESMHDRLAPGTGIGCTAAFVKMVKEKGIKPNAIGVEVISDAILAKGLEYAANHTYENTKKVLEEAWPEVLQ